MSDINVDPNLQGEKVVGLLDQFSDGLKNNHVQILETILILEQKFEVLKLESEASKAELQEERIKLDEKEAKIAKSEKIKPIIGTQMPLMYDKENGSYGYLTFLAQNEAGYKNISKIMCDAQDPKHSKGR